MPEDTRTPRAVADNERRLRFLDALSQETRTLRDARQVMQVTARLLGEYLEASRCAYAQVEADQDHFNLFGDHNRGVDSIVGRYAFSDFGGVLLDLMRAGKPYVNPDVDRSPLTAGTDLTAYRLTQIQAVICVPLHKGGRFVAAMAVHQNTPRDWTQDEIALVQVVVDRCWESMERIRSEDGLREAHSRLSLAMAAGELGDWTWDAATDLTVLSDRAADIFGVPRGIPVLREALRELVHADDRHLAREANEKAVRDDAPYIVEYRVKVGGTVRWVSAHGKTVRSPSGELVGMAGIVQDMTHQRQVRDAERGEAAMLDVLNQTGAALAAELDLQKLLQRATDAATQLTGAEFGAFFYNGTDAQGEAYLLYTLSGAPRSAFQNFGHPRPTALFGPTFTGGPPIRVADILQDPRYGKWGPHHGMPPGHLPVRSYMAVAVISRTGEVIGGLFFGHSTVGVFDERHERLVVGIAGQTAVAVDNARLYEQAQRAGEERRTLLERERAARRDAERANTVKDEFLATLSHELRAPLSAILGWVHILRRKTEGMDPDLHKGVDVIDRSTRAQVQLIDDLLDMSRITSGKLRLDVQPVAPITFIEAAVETVRPAADAAGVRLETMLDPAAGPVSGDPGRLQQVVWNLLSNAVKFTPRGGKVQVLLERVNSHVEITVADTGVGISPAYLPMVFDRFYQVDGSTTRRFGGLGLGLSIVKHLVELHGGRVIARSAGDNAGATFAVHLPVKAVHTNGAAERVHPREQAPVPPPVVDVDLSGLKVLVVDDEADARDLLHRLLADCGAQVEAVDGAAAALAAVPRFRPDVLVSDIGMPGVDGHELLRRVRALGPEQGGAVPAIALTAFARSEDRIRALRAGFAVHVAKPVEPSEILVTVASVAAR